MSLGIIISYYLCRIPVSYTHLDVYKRQLFGHSRKSFFETMTTLPPRDRDIETLTASLNLFGKVDYIRVHNVEIHKRAFETQKILKSTKP